PLQHPAQHPVSLFRSNSPGFCPRCYHVQNYSEGFSGCPHIRRVQACCARQGRCPVCVHKSHVRVLTRTAESFEHYSSTSVRPSRSRRPIVSTRRCRPTRRPSSVLSASARDSRPLASGRLKT
ncbi:hypothetical protein CYLTODRAFT_480821, partial [Cylindrobasidium torrendii FP15055 ss-10]